MPSPPHPKRFLQRYRCASALAYAATLLALSLAGPRTAEAQSFAPTGDPARIVNGVDTQDYPTTGAMICNVDSGGDVTEDAANSCCSGTLVGCETFVVAGHCVDGDNDPDHYKVYLQHAGLLDVSEVVKHPGYSSSNFPIADLGILKLTAPVTGITPTPINDTVSPPFGTVGTLVGFGQTRGSGNDYGIKRRGDVETVDCTGIVSNAGNTELVCWHFENPLGPPGDDSNSCNGDSGGPLFADVGDGMALVGATSGGNNFNCTAPDESYDANVYTYRSFIEGQLIGDSTSLCGALNPVGSPTVVVVANNGDLGLSNQTDEFEITIDPGTDELRVTLNGEDNGSLDADLYVKEGAGVTTEDFDCAVDGEASFGHCNFVAPTVGTYSVLVQRKSGTGQYQATSTVFASPECGNDVTELGEECDGTDDATCSGLCQIDCQCPEPVCGNDVTEAGERCDGTSDAACPGECGLDCACPCLGESVDLAKLRTRDAKLKFRGALDNSSGAFDSLDPREAFAITVTQGLDSVTFDIAADDPGWDSSKPSRGKYIWKGLEDGFFKVRALLKDTTNLDGWKIVVLGKEVADASLIDDTALYDVEITLDTECNDVTITP